MAGKNPIKTITNPLKTQGYKAFTDKNKDTVLSQYGSVVNKFEAVTKTQADTMSGGPTTNRAPFNPWDFERQRPFEVLPRRWRDIIIACRLAYIKVGIVRNVIDLMTDFACQDLQMIHADKRVEAFFKVWSSKVDLYENINEFIRHFLIDANVVVSRGTAKLPRPVETQWLSTQAALPKYLVQPSSTDVAPIPKLKVDRGDLSAREIPWEYHFININALEWIGGETSMMGGKRRLAFKVSQALMNTIKTPSDPFQQMIVSRLPEGVRKNLTTDRNGYIEIDMSKIYVAHNKKDDWEDWSIPLLYAVLSDLHFKDKLRQAEVAALDGVINVIRLWKLGDHKANILPADGSVDRLIDVLSNNTGGGAIDIVWDSMIDMQDYYPPIDKILGSEKYDQVNRDILIGLGVPEVLIGGIGANFSNSFIQLKTIIEKLKYAREAVVKWLNTEVQMVCDGMDIAIPPKIKFGELNLEDANVTKKLTVGLLDRGIISVEAVLHAYGEDFLVEVERMREEKTIFKGVDMKVKGPFDQPPKVPGAGGTGRPVATPSSTQKQRTAKPRRGATANEMIIFAMDAVSAIDEHVIPIYMESIGVSNARKLTSEQKEDIDNVRLAVLSCINSMDDLSKDGILAIAEKAENPDIDIITKIKASISEFISNSGAMPTLSQRKRIEALMWSELQSEKGEIDG